jgi:hypothetical protein
MPFTIAGRAATVAERSPSPSWSSNLEGDTVWKPFVFVERVPAPPLDFHINPLVVVGARVGLPRLTLGRRRRRLPSDEARPQRKECEMAVSKGGLWQAFKNTFTLGKAAKK